MIAIIWCYGRIHHGNFLKWQRKVKHLPQFIEVSTNISVALASRLQQLRTWARCGPKYTLRIFQKTCTLHYYATGSATAKFTCPTSLKVITYHELFLDQIFVLLFHLSYTDMHFTSNVQQQCGSCLLTNKHSTEPTVNYWHTTDNFCHKYYNKGFDSKLTRKLLYVNPLQSEKTNTLIF